MPNHFNILHYYHSAVKYLLIYLPR
jgi:hypothetical protein